MEAIFRFIAQGGQESRLSSLSLFERSALSWRSINHVISLINPTIFPHLHTLQVTCAHLPAICDLQALDTLIIEPLFEDRPVLQDTNANIGGRRGEWSVPSNGCLKHLVIRSEDSKYTSLDEYKTGQVRLPFAPNGAGSGPLRNLQTLKIKYPLLRFDDLDFATICPNLEELELICRDSMNREREVTIPASVKKLTYICPMGVSQAPLPFPFFKLASLPNLVDLTVRHRCDTNMRPWPLDGLLNAPPSLERLCILGSVISHQWKSEYEAFLPRLTGLKVLNIKTLPLSSITINRLREAMPGTEILAGRENLHMPAEGGPPPSLDYDMIEDTTPLIPHPPADGIYYKVPTNIGEPISCDLCAAMVGKNAMEEHKSEVCLKRQILCPLRVLGCNFAGSASEFTKHINECSFYEWECLYCRTTMSVAERLNHLNAHNKVISDVPAPSLSRSSWKTPEFTAVKCPNCPNVLSNRNEAQEHTCKSEKVLMPAALEIIEKWTSKGETPVPQVLKSYSDSFADYPDDEYLPDFEVPPPIPTSFNVDYNFW